MLRKMRELRPKGFLQRVMNKGKTPNVSFHEDDEDDHKHKETTAKQGPAKKKKNDDSDEEVYSRIGQKMTVLDLMEHMITWSSNLATNILIERVGTENVMKLMAELGANDIRVLRGVEDSKAFQAGKNNTTTAYDLMLLLKLIAENKFKSKKACEKMVEILSAQHFNDGIPAGLPTATKVAHKTGEITKHKHDAGIVYPLNGKPYVIVVLTKGIANDKQSSKLIADISSVVYRALAN